MDERIAIRAGARNSSEDAARIQAAHDLMAELGAVCGDTMADMVQPAKSSPRIAAKSIPLAGNRIQIKAISETHATVAGYGVVFGGFDLYGDTFTNETDFELEYVPVKKIFYDHTLSDVKHDIGISLDVKADISGLWVEAQLDRSKAYVNEILQLIEYGVLGWSSGSIGHLVDRKGNIIKKWIVAEFSLTPEPAEPRTIGVQVLKQYYGHADGNGEARTEARVNGAQGSAAVPMASPKSNQPLIIENHIHFGKEPNPTMEPQNTENIIAESVTPLAPVTETPRVEFVRMTSDELERTIKARVDAALDTALAQFNQRLDDMPAIRTAGFVSAKKYRESTQADREALYETAFKHFVRTGNRAGIEAFREYKAAMNETTEAQGGYLVPVAFDNQLVMALSESSILRAAGAKILSISGTDSFKVPSLTNTTRAVKTAEAAAFDEAEPTVGEVEFNPYKYTRLVKVSDELLADSRLDVYRDILIPDVVQAFDAGENEDFTTGDAVGDPQGVITGAGAGVTAAATGAITANELIDLYHSLGHLYRRNAVFMMNDATAKLVRKLVDSDGQYIWQSGLQAGQPDSLLGRPVVINNSMATAAAAAKTVLFGDMRYFWIADFGRTEVKRLDELYAANGQVGFRWYRRYDSNVMLAAAFKLLTQAAA
jgi:HK97 family phage major capsid protein